MTHEALTHVRAELRAILGTTRCAERRLADKPGCNRCKVTVWVENDSLEVPEVAYCCGVVFPASQTVQICWLGRSDNQPVHESVRGRPSVLGPGVGAPNAERRTVAEAMFGLVVALDKIMGANNIHLQVLDNGSGRLVEFYRRHNLELLPKQVGEIHYMQGPADAALWLAPERWLAEIIPENFDVAAWVSTQLSAQHIVRALRVGDFGRTTTDRLWSWNVAWPEGARVDMVFTVSDFSLGGSAVKITLLTKEGIELAFGRAGPREHSQQAGV